MGERYYITRTGRVFTKAKNRTNVNKKIHERKLFINKKGYRIVSLHNTDGKIVTRQVSRLVYEAFVGAIPHGYHIDHIDNDKSNNHVSNLRAVTPGQNNKFRDEFYQNRAKMIKSTCKFCKKEFEYIETSSIERIYCRKRCQQQWWAVEYKKKTGRWSGATARSERRRIAREARERDKIAVHTASLPL